MAANLLEVEHHVGKALILNFFSSSLKGDGPVLAKNASKIAVGEEDRARPMSSHQGYLLAKMRLSAENYESCRSLAKPFLTL
jgi:hypothetical protein